MARCRTRSSRKGRSQLGPEARPQRDVTGTVRPNTVATLPPEDQPETGKFELPAQFKRQLVTFQSTEPAGTIVIDTANTHLYLVLGNGQAMRYGIGVGREGFTWAGAERVSKMSEWPDWHPPAEMIERQPYLPRFMAGGEGNPLGARALYLGKTLYRIHGTNQPSTIGKYVSSGCIRLTNEDIQDLYSRVQVGTRVVVLPGRRRRRPRTRRRRSSSRCSSGKLADAIDDARPRRAFSFIASCVRPRASASTITVTCSRSTGSGMRCSFSSSPISTMPCTAENIERASSARRAGIIAGASLCSGSSI